MAGSRIRLKDIAEATGFSVNTVSLALRGSDRIPRETQALIVASAERLNYLPNRIARSLVSRATHTIGLVLTDIMNPTLTHAARTIERLLGARGYSMMFAASDNVIANEIRALDVLRSHQVDGLLVYPTTHGRLDHIEPLRRAGYPVVLLTAEATASIDSVAVDDRRGAHVAVSHLLRLGHRQVGFLDAGRPHGNSEKAEGYERALREHGIAPDPRFVVAPDGPGARAGFDAMARLMRSVTDHARPTALFASTDAIAIGALAWCREHGVRVPDDLAIVGYDNIEAGAFAEVPLTTVDYAADAVGDLAVERLMALIANDSEPARMTLIAPELIVRRSCGADRKAVTRR